MKRSLIIMGLFAAALQFGCSAKQEEEEEVKYLVTSPIRKDTVITKDYVCQIHSISHIELRAQERGFLQQIFVDEGQYVKQGQLLFQIMPKLYEAEFQMAQAEAEYAEIEYRNTKMLADSNIVSKNQLALVKAKLDKANAELALAKVHLGFTEIHAPFSGIIDKFHVRLGSLIDEGDLLTNLSDNSHMWVYFNVSEAEYLDYKAKVEKDSSIKVSLMMANNKLFDYPGVVETIEADFNNETGNVAFRATFPNPKGLLRHGETGNILMEIPYENAMIIPQKATFEILDKKYVYVVDEKGVVKSREIKIGAELEDLYIISGGLADGEKILLEGIRKVRDDQQITYDYQKPEDVIYNLKVYAE